MTNESAAHATSCNELLLGPFRQAFIDLWIINLIPLLFQIFGYHDRGMSGHYHDLLNDVGKELVLISRRG